MRTEHQFTDCSRSSAMLHERHGASWSYIARPPRVDDPRHVGARISARVAHLRLNPVSLPVSHRCDRAADLLGCFTLQESEVQPTLANVVTPGFEGRRIGPFLAFSALGRAWQKGAEEASRPT